MTIHRSESYKAFIRKQPCIVCGKTPSDAHHCDILKSGGTSIKGHDSQCLPFCRAHHREYHNTGGKEICTHYPWIDLEKEIIRHLTKYMIEREI